MSYRNRQALSLYVVSRASLCMVLFFLLYLGLAGAIAQVVTPANLPGTLPEVSDSEEFSPLTIPQQKARQLATILIGKRESSSTSTQRTPLEVIAERAMRLGQHPVATLFTSSHFEGQLRGGRQTFASPVDQVSSTAKEDARRPLFLPASQSMMALEVLAK